MSNPTVTIGNSIPGPPDPKVERKTYTRIVYESQRFFTYAEGEYDGTYSGAIFDPSDKGERFYMFIPVENVLDEGSGGVKPSFVSIEAWGNADSGWGGGVRASPSGFVNVVRSVMPKIIVASEILVDNGLKTTNDNFAGLYKDGGGAWLYTFNFELDEFNGGSIPANGFYRYGSTGAFQGSQYVTIRGKDDLEALNLLTMKLRDPSTYTSDYPKGSNYDWIPDQLVVAGAFQMLLNVVPERPASSSPRNVHKQDWALSIQFGEVEMVMSDAGSMKVRIGGGAASDDDGNWTVVNLSEGKAKDSAPQHQHIDEKAPYLLLVYPVWNGIVVASGTQEGRATPSRAAPVFSSSYYVPKLKRASVLEQPWSDGFDPASPAAVEVGVGSGDNLVKVDFGTQIDIIAKNCRFDMAYVPAFFCKKCQFDEWFVTSDDIGGLQSFEYNVYPIWTANNTGSILDPAPEVTESPTVGPLDDTHYSYIQWRLEQDSFNRFGGEIFGSILEVIEERQFPVKNDNGSFELTWTPDPNGEGDPTPAGWTSYIQSLSVSVTIDGSSGTATVDKYGVAGQHAIAAQSIGAFTVSAAGGYGTVDGSIFQGLAMGISDAKSVDGATWSIPLVGLEKKLEDIALINVPFFDGEPLGTAIDFLTRYGGIVADVANANTGIPLSASQDINVARFDWKSGTSVKTALDEVMEDTLHWYVVRDGSIYFYQLNSNGLPIFFGPDWESSYPNTKIVMTDQNPDFDDLRNEIVVLGLEAIPSGQGAIIDELPNFLHAEKRTNLTIPDVPWAKSIVRPMPGFITEATLSDQADRLANMTSKYEVLGRTSIPGNANIKPYDRWGGFVIYSVTHNLDMNAKTWTTDLEFSTAA